MPYSNKIETFEIQEFSVWCTCFRKRNLSLNYKRKASSVPLMDMVLSTKCRKHHQIGSLDLRWPNSSSSSEYLCYLVYSLKCWTPINWMDSCLQTVLGRLRKDVKFSNLNPKLVHLSSLDDYFQGDF